MLKDPNFNVKELILNNLDKGVVFSEYYFDSPIDCRKLPSVVGMTDLNHSRWESQKYYLEKPVRLMLAAKHSTGIYFGYPIDDAIEGFSTTKIISEYPYFDLSNGMWYSREEFSESMQYGWDDCDIKTLKNGKPRPHHSRIADSYGLADDITQILRHFRKVVSSTEYDVVLHLNHHTKEEMGGMRWHKNGQYLGNLKKTQEYMSDEVGLKSILQYHFYVIEQEMT